MTVTLDSKTLDCKQLSENCQIIVTQWDAWISAVFKRKVKVLGVVRVWTLSCVENNVAWGSSQAKSFEDSGKAGTELAFAVTDEVRVISTNVYVLGVIIDAMDLAGKNIRRFTLTLQEA
jgi:hypothetical protein